MASVPMLGDHTHLQRGAREEFFSELEWHCAVYVWRGTGQRGGMVQMLFLTDEGSIEGEALETLEELVTKAETQLLERQLTHDLSLSPAGAVILAAVKKAKIPYLRAYDSKLVVLRGTKKVGEVDADEGLPRVGRLGDLAPFRSALAKLRSLTRGQGPLVFRRCATPER